MENEEFIIIENKIEELEKKRNEFLEVDKNKLVEKYNKQLYLYRKILSLMIDGQMYRDLRQQKRERKEK